MKKAEEHKKQDPERKTRSITVIATMGLKGSSIPFLAEVKFPRNIRLPNSRSLMKLLGSRDLKTMMEATHTVERAASGTQDALFGADRCELAGDESGETASCVLQYVERELDQIAESTHYLLELMSKLRNDGSSSSADSETPSIVSELAHLKDFEDSVHMEVEQAEKDFSASDNHTVPPIISVNSIYFLGDSARQDYECNDNLSGLSPTRELKTETFVKNSACHPYSNRSPLIMPGFPVAQFELSQLPHDKSTPGVQRVIRIPMMTSSKITGSSDSDENEEFEIFRVVQTPFFSSLESWEYPHKLNDRSEQPVYQSMFDTLLNIPGFLARNNVFSPTPRYPIKGKACSCIHHCHCGRSDEETVDTATESSSSGFFDSD
jgi:hypothetical protein